MTFLRSTGAMGVAGRIAVAAVSAFCLAEPGSAQEVTQEAALLGDFGLRVPVGKGCTADDLVVAPPPPLISGEYVACLSIVAEGVQAEAGATTIFTAGESIALGEGFSAAEGAVFKAQTEPSTKVSFAYVVDESPVAADTYSAFFYTNVEELTLEAGTVVDHLVGLAEGGETQFWVRIVDEGAGAALSLAARVDSGGVEETPLGQSLPLQNTWNRIEVEWATGDGTGFLAATVNGTLSTGLYDLNNPVLRIEKVHWGSVAGNVLPLSGHLSLDGFSSRQ